MHMDKSINEPLLDPNEESSFNAFRASQVDEEDEEPVEDKLSERLGDEPQGKSIQHGIDIGQTDQVGAHFVSYRQQAELIAEGDDAHVPSLEQVNGRQYVDMLINQHEQTYQKKIPFERGQYHQCIPNPRKKNQLITVQLVKQVLNGVPVPGNDEDELDAFEDDQQVSGNNAMTFQRFRLVPPGKADDIDDDEGDDDEDDSMGGSQVASFVSRKMQSSVLKSTIGPADGDAYNEDIDALYEKTHLNEKVDQLTGISPKYYADVDKSTALQKEVVNNFLGTCEEIAVIAFWELLQDGSEKFECKRHFYVPNPKKRCVRDIEGTELQQVLYTSAHNKDVFFFFKGPEVTLESDLTEISDLDAGETYIQCAFLNLDPDASQTGERDIVDCAERSSIQMNKHCTSIKKISSDSVLHRFIQDLNNQGYKEQDQLPNPTMIDTVEQSQAKSVVSNLLSAKLSLLKGIVSADGDPEQSIQRTIAGRTVIFTAYLAQKDDGEDEQGSSQVEECWYPTVYFYDLDADKVVWKIQGAEAFIGMTETRKIFVFGSKIWHSLDYKIYRDLIDSDPDYIRFQDYQSSIKEMDYMQQPILDDDERQLKLPFYRRRAPEYLYINKFRMNFGVNKNLSITQEARVFEAHLHNKNQRVTLLYHGVGAFTFRLLNDRPLTKNNEWLVQHNEQQYRAMMIYEPVKSIMTGEGIDENDETQKITVEFEQKDTFSWKTYFDTTDGTEELTIPSLIFNKEDNTVSSQWRDDDDGIDFNVEGSYDPETRHVEFTLANSQEEEVMVFKGAQNDINNRIIGTWTLEGQEEGSKRKFSMIVTERLQGVVTIQHASDTDVKIPVELCLKDRIIQSMEKRSNWSEPPKFEMEAIDAVDTAMLSFFIFQPDVTFMRYGMGSFVQAKLFATDDEDENSNGKGIVLSSVVLYRVSEPIQKHKQQSSSGEKKIKYKKEPEEQREVKFYTNQALLRSQEEGSQQLVQMNPSIIDENGRFISSVQYERTGSDELEINFVTASLNVKKSNDQEDDEANEKPPEYPQSPVKQQWIVDYPLMAYKTFSPANNEISIVHLAVNMPQRRINLGKWEFVTFVHHTQMTEAKLYGWQNEKNSDITFLVRYLNNYRLMSFKSNPWLEYNCPSTQKEEQTYKQSLFLFSGKFDICPIPQESQAKQQPYEDHVHYIRRFSSDRIQSVQLITKSLASVEQYMLILQFEDTIVQASMNTNTAEIICEPTAMIRRHMVRGFNEKVFFAETQGSAEKVQMLEFHTTRPNEIVKREIFSFAGSWIIAMEPDANNIANDADQEVTNSLYIIDDQQKIYLLSNENEVRFNVNKIIDFSGHNLLKEINALRDNDWAHVHITDRTLSFGETCYNLNSSLVEPICVPKHYFGEDVDVNDINHELKCASKHDDDDQDDDDDEENDEDEGDYSIEDIQHMPETNNIIMIAQREHREFCFIVKPAMGTRRVNIVAHQQQHEVRQMLFVSDSHILLKFKGGKAVIIQINGIVAPQDQKVQEHLDESIEVICQSNICNSKKFLLLKRFYGGENSEKERYVCLRFDRTGQGVVVGKFDEPVKNFKSEMISRLTDQDGDPTNLEISMGELLLTAQSTLQNTRNYSQMKTSKAIQYANKMKEFQSLYKIKKQTFVNEHGEIVKIAAMVSPVEEIKEEIRASSGRKSQKVNQKKKRQSEFLQIGAQKDIYISIFATGNQVFQTGDKECQFKTIVIHCATPQEVIDYTRHTEFILVGDYLVMRPHNDRSLWFTQIREKGQKFMQINDPHGQPGHLQQEQLRRKMSYIPLLKMCSKDETPLFSMSSLQKGSPLMIKSRKQLKLQFYTNLLQLQVAHRAIVYDLDEIKEVASIEHMDQLMNPDNTISSGFNMSTCLFETQNEQRIIRNKELDFNETENLLFMRTTDTKADGSIAQTISGTLYRSYSELDLYELRQLNKIGRQKVRDIDLESVVSCYEGQTFFSIFSSRLQIKVLEKVRDQLQDKEFEKEEGLDGDDIENQFLRRLFCALTLPVADFQNAEKKIQKIKLSENIITSGWKNFVGWSRQLFGLGHGENDHFRAFGFKSYCQKSLYFESSRFREALMQIMMLCDETQLSDFVENIEDLEILFVQLTPIVSEFLDNSFNENYYTRRIKNINWKAGSNLEVFGSHSQITSAVQTQQDIHDGIVPRASDSSKIVNREITSKYMSLDWLHSNYKGYDKPGCRELIVSLSEAPNESLFSTELVISLSTLFDKFYYGKIWWYCFLPYAVYFSATVIYLSNYAVDGILPEDRFAFTFEFMLRWIVVAGVCFFTYFELVAILRDGFEYFKDPFNFFDLLLPFLNLSIVYETVAYEANESRAQERTLAALAVFLMWCKAFYWLKLFSSTSFYIRLIIETLWDVRYFIILFLFILMTFGNAFLIMDQDREQKYTQDYFGVTVLNVLFDQYLLSLGEFNGDDNDGYVATNADRLFLVVFIASTFITQITFFNMIIAIMGDTFSRVSEVRAQSALREKITIMADYVHIVPSDNPVDSHLFMYNLQPTSVSQNEGGAWEGSITALKKTISDTQFSIVTAIGKKMRDIQTEVCASHRQFKALEERINEQSGSMQKRLSAIEEDMSENKKATKRQLKAITRSLAELPYKVRGEEVPAELQQDEQDGN